MYTTGDLDKSTHEKLMYVGSTHLEVKKKKKKWKRCQNYKDKKLPKFYMVSNCK